MGILNVTPDSFSDGNRFVELEAAVAHGLRMLDDGADVVDIGGESTRPGADPVSVEEQCRRVVPVIEGIHAALPDALISIDTTQSEVARAAIHAGAGMVNDVSAMSDPDMAPLCAETGVQLVLMHMRGAPRTMQLDTSYVDLVGEIVGFLRERAAHAQRCGVAEDHIIIDPGVGFGKAGRDNPPLIAAVPTFKTLGYRVLIGASRKSFIGALTGVREAGDRLGGSIGAALAAAEHGADLLRVHDVATTHHALTVFRACTGRP
jgi:dihydropteroate synthase